MIYLRQPRLWIALLLGVAAGIVVWTLPPLPDWTARLPNMGTPRFASPFNLVAVTSNGRFLITEGRHSDEHNRTVCVWDRARRWETAALQVRVSVAEVLLSPDETKLVIVGNVPREGHEPARTVLLYDLASAEKLGQWEVPCERALFGNDGRLLAVADGVLLDLAANRELRRLPKSIDGYNYAHTIHDFAAYQTESRLRLYSWHTGELHAEHELVSRQMHVRMLSRDGQVFIATGGPPGPIPWTHHYLELLRDGASGKSKTTKEFGALSEGVLSPDGRYLATHGEWKRASWLPNWWPGPESAPSVRFTRLTTETDLVEITNIDRIDFSPQGDLVALTRDDHVIEGYRFPFRKPWGLIVSAAFVAAWVSWGSAWLWGRWRNRA